MPTIQEHGDRIKSALFWIEKCKPKPSECLNPLAVEYFYAALHMLEATAERYPVFFDGKTGFDEHKIRNTWIGKLKLTNIHPLKGMATPYLTLYTLSRRARYLMQSNTAPVAPLRQSDLITVVRSFDEVRKVFEKFYKDQKSPLPWAVTPSAPATQGLGSVPGSLQK